MKISYVCAVLLLFHFAFSHPLGAETYTWQNGTKTDLGKIADAKTLLGAEKYETYRVLLGEKDCDSAAIVLNIEFVHWYPELSFVDEKEGEAFLEWKHHFAEEKYVELTFCYVVNSLEELEEKRKSGASEIGLFRLLDRPANDNEDWRSRDISIRSMMFHGDAGHLPALNYLGQLARQGDVFHDSKEVEYFIFTRACAKGFRCSENIGRLRELEKKFTSSKALELKGQAASLEFRIWDYFFNKTLLPEH